ncbi:MAG: hypothetical protein FJ116_10290 [Deltaproteobacteria bacterium]|nr:hypothetical protein [Deltaproteobacteria bacterium]
MESFLKRTLIVPDYDGTLTGSNGVVSGQNRAVLDVLGKQNHLEGLPPEETFTRLEKLSSQCCQSDPFV